MDKEAIKELRNAVAQAQIKLEKSADYHESQQGWLNHEIDRHKATNHPYAESLRRKLNRSLQQAKDNRARAAALERAMEALSEEG